MDMLSARLLTHSSAWFTAMYTFGLEFVPSFYCFLLLPIFAFPFLHLFINFIFLGSLCFFRMSADPCPCAVLRLVSSFANLSNTLF